MSGVNMFGAGVPALPGKALALISSFLSPSKPENPAALAARPEPSDAETGVAAVVFSKDRPGQLLACVASALANVQGVTEWRIVYHASNQSAETRYREAFARLRACAKGDAWSRVRIVRENDQKTFGVVVKEVMEAVKAPFVWFQVDDAIHFDVLPLDEASRILVMREDVLGVHTKLWPGITKCNAGSTERDMVRPSLVKTDNSNGFELYTFRRAEGTLDWNYAFDLSGGLYRTEDVRLWMGTMAEERISSPNRLELCGNDQWAAMSVTRPWSACLQSPVLSILAINRVQSEFPDNKIFTSQFETSKPWQGLTDSLFTQTLDLDKYHSVAPTWSSVHTGDLYLAETAGSGISCTCGVDASVLIPCKNAESTIVRALRSVIDQELDNLTIEIIVVDDCSSDATAFLVEQEANDQVRLVLRPNSTDGVAGCLNYGLEYCHGEFIIRMDADDEMLPGRIKAQVEHMRKYPAIGVVGCQTLIRKDDGKSSIKLMQAVKPTPQVPQGADWRWAPCPTGCAFLAWSLFFYCPLVHPAVCIRKKAITEAGGYAVENNGHHCEDYALWHRILSNGWVLENLDLVGLVHNKHPASVTASWSRLDLAKQTADLTLKSAMYHKFALKGVDPTKDDWLELCGEGRKPLDIQAKQRLCSILDALKDIVIDEFRYIAVDDDLARVSSDCEARKVEINAR